jgi:murein DD-endopeptidase MepM/ murein hydrolase activator NlpD
LTKTAQVSTPVATVSIPSPTFTLPDPTATPEPSQTEEPTALPTFTDLPQETNTPAPTNTIDPNATAKPPILYYTQSGDTLPSIEGRFNVSANEVTASEKIPATGLINPGLLLVIPDHLNEATTTSDEAMPDSEVVYSPSATDFDIDQFIENAGGYLSTYVEQMGTGNYSGAYIVKLVALENSTNPYLLLSILEYKSHWVYGQPGNLAERDYPMGFIKVESRGLYHQLSWAVQQLSIGYYGWRAGTLTDLTYIDNTNKRMGPALNAGTAALQYLFAQWYDPQEWNSALYGDNSMPALMEKMFGSFWERSKSVEPLYPTNLTQPTMQLPFVTGTWSFTGGPHPAWGPGGALAALDFAPPSSESGCVRSDQWVTAVAPGVVVRVGDGVVIEDLDGDGNELTGWVIMYLHIETRDKVALGTRLNTDDKIGHPSCEGGEAVGTHLHIARKFNGEWMLAGGPVPFDLSGYVASNGDAPYLGSLSNGIITVIAAENSAPKSAISRP